MEKFDTNKVLEYLEKKDKNIAKVYGKTYQIHTEIINDYERLYTSLSEKYYTQKKEKEGMEKLIEELKMNLEKANQQKSAVLLIGEDMEKQVREKEEENRQLKEQFESQVKELKSKVEEAEKENKVLVDKLVTHAKERADKILINGSIHKNLNSENKDEKNYEVGKQNKFSEDLNQQTDSFKLFNIGSAKRNEQVGKTNIRIMTLKQLKDIINEIYVSKAKHDEKCKKTRLPLETMEQFMFTHLNQKYGLKNLIIEWAASIVNGVKLYLKEDSDVALFAKLLKNEVEEDFRYIQEKIKTTISKVLKKHIREKYKHKGEIELNELQENLEQGFISNST